jgi:hypothetical protein
VPLPAGAGASGGPLRSLAGAPAAEQPGTNPNVTLRPVTFYENGLLIGTRWSAQLGGTVRSGVGREIGFAVRPGEYAYTIPTVAGYLSEPANGSVDVATSGAFVTVLFTAVDRPGPYAVTFQESGLDPGTSWSVAVGSYVGHSTSSGLTLSLYGGSYSYTVTAPIGYRPDPASGVLTVLGPSENVTVRFAPAGAAEPRGASWIGSAPSWEWGALAATAIAAILVGAALVRRRRASRAREF